MIIVSAFYISYWAYSTVWVVSTGKLEDYPQDKQDWNTKPFRGIEMDDSLKNKLYLQGFGLFWNVAFLLTLSNFIINGAVCFWYHNTSTDIKHPITTTLWWAIRYHLGTIAFGSFILAVIWVFRVIAEYLHQKQQQQKRNGKDNSTAKLILCCIKCILVICEKLIKFINRHSYTEVILRSTNFCSSARHAMTLVKNNITRFGVLHGLGSVVMMFAKMFIIFVTMALSYFLLNSVYDFQDEDEQESQMNSMGPPLVAIFILSLSISSLFAHVWEVSCDVILHCYCLDEAIQGNRGSRQARHATGKLHDVVASAKSKNSTEDDSYGYL